ncbi:MULTISPECIES: hypothetical protein [unclassified Frankia]|uniref:hypothetical protein n=1 Tax=unclassified Frankia TaxID=2632575 RepID=UPI002AD4B46E|nr:MULTISPECIES: hypothetical protein [unclassified Frankia]
MRELIASVDGSILAQELPSELCEICDEGWSVSPCGSYVLAALYDPSLESIAESEGLPYLELEVNDVKIPDLDLLNDLSSYLPRVASRGLSFAVTALGKARKSGLADSLVAVVSTGVGDDYLTHGTTVKFYTRRDNYPDWFDDLERFAIEAMALIEGVECGS